MASGDKQLKGHLFPFDGTACRLCGMTQTAFDDSGQPTCTGRRPAPIRTDDDSAAEPFVRPDDDSPTPSRRRKP